MFTTYQIERKLVLFSEIALLIIVLRLIPWRRGSHKLVWVGCLSCCAVSSCIRELVQQNPSSLTDPLCSHPGKTTTTVCSSVIFQGLATAPLFIWRHLWQLICLTTNQDSGMNTQRQSDDDGEAYVLVVVKSRMIMAEVLDLIDKRRHWAAFGFILRQKMTAISRWNLPACKRPPLFLQIGNTGVCTVQPLGPGTVWACTRKQPHARVHQGPGPACLAWEAGGQQPLSGGGCQCVWLMTPVKHVQPH